MSADPVGVEPQRTPSTDAVPPAVSPAVGDPRSTGQILKGLVTELQTLFRQEVELAKHELRDAVVVRVQAAVAAIVGAIFGLFALGFLGVTIGTALREVLPAWAAWAIVFAGYLLVAVVALLVARSRATSTPMKPEATQRSMEETKTWAKQQLRR